MPNITIGRRFTGPPNSGNGGYTAGTLALAARGIDPSYGPEHAVTVTLRTPPPLGVPMDVERAEDAVTLRDGDALVAEARPGSLSHDPVPAVPFARARDLQSTYAGLEHHPFPTCFTCGTDREPGDGLRLSPGLLEDGRTTACTWTPDPSLGDSDGVAPAFVWAALDCPGAWTADLSGRPLVLGRITALVGAPVRVGEPYVVMGRMLGQQGRKMSTATTLYSGDRAVARAEQVWITVDPGAFQ
ncbi:MAG: hypothetical protein GEU93_11830 [Propionibacteriales bacterium]|nr:hypothetical protein [Propionibacteriales bacterium]